MMKKPRFCVSRFIILLTALLFLLPVSVHASHITLAVVDTHSPDRRVTSMFKDYGITVRWIKSLKANPAKYDGLVVPGDVADITPELYGQKNTNSKHCNLDRDILQCAAILRFAAAGKPVFGICGGLQHINVAFGGTLKQHLEDRHVGYRTIAITPGTFLYAQFKKQENVYHKHYQAIQKTGKGLVATQWDKTDGTIEAIVHKTLPVYGIQYHPERMDAATRKKVVSWFTSVCRKTKKKSVSISKSTMKFLQRRLVIISSAAR